MTPLETAAAEDRRRLILALLAQSPQYRASGQLLLAALPGFGHAVSEARLAADLAWLQDSGLIFAEPTAGVVIARLSARGIDVAEDRARADGVARALPKA